MMRRLFKILNVVCMLMVGGLSAMPLVEYECPDQWEVYPCRVGEKVIHVAFPEPPELKESDLVTYYRANLGTAQYCLIAYKQAYLHSPKLMQKIYREIAEECFDLKPRCFEDIVILQRPTEPLMLDMSTFAKDTILKILSLDMRVHDRTVVSFSDPYLYNLCSIQPEGGPDYHPYFFHSFQPELFDK